MATKQQTPKNPNNRDILQEIRAFRVEYSGIAQDVRQLMDWKRGLEIADNAVEAYKRKEQQQRSEDQELRSKKTKTDLMKDLIPLAVALTALIYAVLQGAFR